MRKLAKKVYLTLYCFQTAYLLMIQTEVLLLKCNHRCLNLLSDNPVKWSNMLKQFVGKSHFMRLTLKGLKCNDLVEVKRFFTSWKMLRRSCRKPF